jgi:hypothetical protein
MPDDRYHEPLFRTRQEIRENYATVMRIHSAPMLSFLTRCLADAGAAEDIALQILLLVGAEALLLIFLKLHQSNTARS